MRAHKQAITAAEIDRRFDDGEDVTEFFDMEHPILTAGRSTKKVNMTMPTWMIRELDAQASSLAVSRNAVINLWLSERLQREQERRRELVAHS
ncbi:hypothetical protein KIMH_11110 [Bombiscardovia apis]|uniref:CopG family transcriptional regulator n=1 Tax=Bombiscardovia apis TaxID=2932182 RepID=A0ABN6SJZ2_9BIFI|nr:hypothetical protein [Bombiscardovia apis]BDR55000.1 hypothetical protein KIMH_11110 [Bombiscardovia apis]